MAAYQKLYEIQDSGVNPKNEAGVFSRYTFGWMSDILATGKARPLENSDLLPLLDELKSQGQTDKLEEAWNKELESNHKGWYPQGFKLFKSLLKILPWYEYAFQVSVILIYVASMVMQPVLLSLLLSLLTSERRESFWWVYIYGAGIGLSSASSSCALVHLVLNCSMLSLRWKVASAGFIFKKVGNSWPPDSQDFGLGRLRPDVRPLTLSNTIFGSKSEPFHIHPVKIHSCHLDRMLQDVVETPNETWES